MIAIPKKRISTKVLFKGITLKIKTSGFEVDIWRTEKCGCTINTKGILKVSGLQTQAIEVG